MPSLQEEDTYALVERTLGQPLFFDDERTAQARAGEIPREQYPERAHIYGLALRGLATIRRYMRLDGSHETNGSADPGVVFDPAAAMNRLHDALQPQRRRLQLVNNLEHHIADAEANQNSPLREQQQTVFGAIRAFLNSKTPEEDGVSTKAGYIKMPTGSGKTVVTVELIKALHSYGDSVKTAVLVPRKEIKTQTIGQKPTEDGQGGKRGFAEFAPDMDVTEYSGDKKDLSGEVVVMTYQSFIRARRSGVLPDDFCDIVICDEAHETLGPTISRYVREFSRNKLAIGLTATDAYAENKKVSQLFPEQIYELGLREAIEEGILHPLQAWLYKTDVNIDQDFHSPDYTQTELDRLVNLEARNRKAVELAKSFIEQGMQGLISCVPGQNLLHTRILGDMLRNTTITDPKTGEQRSIRVQELSGEMPIEERQQYYRRYEAGEIDVFTFVDVIGMGWDSTAAKFLINTSPTCSPVKGVQFLGRILRPNGSDIPAQVVDFVDNTKKAQFTALHALGEYRYVLDKVYGKFAPLIDGAPKRITLPDHLMQHVRKINLVKVRDLFVGRKDYRPTFSSFVDAVGVAERLGMSFAALQFVSDKLGITVREQASKGNTGWHITELEAEKLTVEMGTMKYDIIRTMSAEEIAALFAKNTPTQTVRTVVPTTLNYTVIPPRSTPVQEPGRTETESRLTDLQERLAADNVTIGEYVSLCFNDGTDPLLKQAQGLALESLARQPYIAISVLNQAKQAGVIRNVVHTSEPTDVGFYHTVAITINDGEVVAMDATRTSKKTAQQDASLLVLGRLTGHEAIRDQLTQAPVPVLQEALTHALDNPKGRLNNLLQGRGTLAGYQTQQVMGAGKRAIFQSTVSITIGDETVTVTGVGSSRRDAEQDAAARTLLESDIAERLPVRKAKPAVRQAPQDTADPQEVLTASVRGDLDPVSFLNARSQKLKLPKARFSCTPMPDGNVHCNLVVPINRGATRAFEFTGPDRKTARETVANMAIQELGLKAGAQLAATSVAKTRQPDSL